jgi:hypothetical protein
MITKIFWGLVSLILVTCFQNCEPHAGLRQSLSTESPSSKESGSQLGGGSYDGKLFEMRNRIQCADGRPAESSIGTQNGRHVLLRENCQDLKMPFVLSDTDIKTDAVYDDFVFYKDRPYFLKQNFRDAELLCDLSPRYLGLRRRLGPGQMGLALYKNDEKGKLTGRLVLYIKDRNELFDSGYQRSLWTFPLEKTNNIVTFSPKGEYVFSLMSRQTIVNNISSAFLSFSTGSDLHHEPGNSSIGGTADRTVQTKAICVHRDR